MYKIVNEETIHRLEDGVYIPRDLGNADFQKFLEWEEEGNEVLPPDPTPVHVPQEVSAGQAYAALMAAGLYDEVEAWAASSDTDPLHRLAFQKGTTFRRDSLALAAGAAALGWNSQILDELFISADAIRL
ncbi:hypothetical protein [Achromobacter sp. ACRQX]|uniref:hypothetical protein n=1 Tax=Achromobacter sp. ACRQX TaxID=2918181 RepID=UPI001EF37A3A|nr:hypothetical protein [Achromobacter sp. ACRQX]MCG7328070.1 hypothetical protein [Achromobacter sp. ACRQX]